MIYVALLRGINVGGNNIINMKKLKQTFESCAFQQVTTYINSGNIIFKSPLKNPDKVASTIEEAIANDFQLQIKVLIRTLPQIEHIINNTPPEWVNDSMMKTDVLFLWKSFQEIKQLTDFSIYRLNEIQLEDALIWNITKEHLNASKYAKLVGTKAYQFMTIRNINTVRKIYEIMTSLKEK